MRILQRTLYIITYVAALLSLPLTGYSQELSLEEVKDINMKISADFAANYLDEMNQVQAELVTKHLKYRDLILASAGGSLNKRLPYFLEDEAKLKNLKLDAPTLYLILSISTMKLGILAQQFGLIAPAGCHAKESRNLEMAANGGEPVMANCRAAAYGDMESSALRLSTAKEAETIAPLVNKWVQLNMLYSRALACVSGYCL